ncbi:hypothetical protein ACIF6L_34715 [Kitasatospora sp. NPDC086009]|uniref:hypothetical protein n=1 Tax=unclassified Kitasatospora TaxID=2633591 RepID=UPI0037C547CE
MPKTTTATAETALPEPPAAAVAADAHWAAKLERLRNRPLATAVLRLWDDVALKTAFNAIEERAARAALMAAATPEDESRRIVAEAAAAELADAKAGADQVATTLTFRALPGSAYPDLVRAHPPTPEQVEEDPEVSWNVDTFPAALIAASNTDGIDEELAAEFMRSWGHADRVDLFQAALSVQSQSRGDLGKG